MNKETIIQSDMKLQEFKELYERINGQIITPKEFEVFTVLLYELIGYSPVVNTPDQADRGVDVIAHDEREPTYIECKKYTSNVGRPVVQKLHSVIIADGVKKGAIVTTAGFSSEAESYVNDLLEQGIVIRLIDGKELKGISDEILEGNPEPDAYRVLGTDFSANMHKIRNEVEKLFFSFPNPNRNLINVRPKTINLLERYSITYSIDQTFSTSVGTIYSLHLDNVNQHFPLLSNGKPVWGNSLLEVKQGWAVGSDDDHLWVTIPDYRQQALEVFDASTVPDPPNPPLKPMTASIRETLKRLHTVTVRYRGANNQTYRKLCVPNPKSFNFHDSDFFIVPSQEYAIGFKNRIVVMAEGSDLRYPDTFKKCSVSGKRLNRKDGRVCQLCYAMVHKKQAADCRRCFVTVCKDCSQKSKHHWLFTDHWCPMCHDEFLQDGQRNRDPKKEIEHSEERTKWEQLS